MFFKKLKKSFRTAIIRHDAHMTHYTCDWTRIDSDNLFYCVSRLLIAT